MEVVTERIESLKAGAFAAVSFTLAYGVVLSIDELILAVRWQGISQLQFSLGIDLGVKIAIAFLNGFLFGVTYRYIIRGDRNSHLKDGAVLAFGLVRGCAPIQVFNDLYPGILLLAILAIESIVCFATARFTLDLALQRGFLKPFS
jgi:hypothetical protein